MSNNIEAFVESYLSNCAILSAEEVREAIRKYKNHEPYGYDEVHVIDMYLIWQDASTSDSSISITWHVDDVLSIRPDLTSDQALQVLHRAKKFHNPEIGINWEVLNIHAGALFGDKP